MIRHYFDEIPKFTKKLLVAAFGFEGAEIIYAVLNSIVSLFKKIGESPATDNEKLSENIH